MAERQLQPNANQAKVYRVGAATADIARKSTLGAQYDVHSVSGAIEVPPQRPRDDYIETVDAEEKALEVDMANKSLFVQGLAGTGKRP